MKFILVLSLTLFTAHSWAGTPCKNLTSCVSQVSKMTGEPYFFDGKLKGSVLSTTKFKLNKSNADYFLSMILNSNGLTRVRLEGKEGYQIVNARDIRYMPTKLYTDVSKLPHTYDYVMLTIDLDGLRSSEVTRSFRPFMSRYGRIIDIRQKNRIIIQDSAINAKRLAKLVKSMDAPLTDDEKKLREEEKEHRREIALLRAKNGTDIHWKIDDLKKEIRSFRRPTPRGAKRSKK